MKRDAVLVAEPFREVARAAGRYIAATQLPSGAIPWFAGAHIDPWDHVESAIGLDIVGAHDEAVAAYRWLAALQNEDGSWWSGYREVEAIDRTRDSNFSSYVAVGTWLHFLLTGDRAFLAEAWPTVASGIDFALALQGPAGEIYWARDGEGRPWPEALTAGSSCVYLSLRCAIAAAEALGHDSRSWLQSAQDLAGALRHRPHAFAHLGRQTERYAMDWYYPVLAGVLPTSQARTRLRGRWQEFVAEDWGARCVADEPWVTVAETCELAMALVRAGQLAQAADLLAWVQRFRDGDGAFWTGGRIADGIVWPEEKPTWTSAAVIMAAAALGRNPAVSQVFG